MTEDQSKPRQRRSTRERVDGILLLDKPQGITSNRALQHAKYLLNAKKAGHTGSLDPLATGLLPLCFGEATKLSSYLLESNKTYRSVFKLGSITETGDSDGEVVQSWRVDVSRAQIADCLESFRGPILQTPPMYSALKKDGQPLYKLARKGITVEREARPVTVHALELEDFDEAAHTVTVTMTCSSGFYVRVLATDLGEMLGCGAHVQELRRTGVAGFTVDAATDMPALESAPDAAARREFLMEPDVGLSHIPALSLSVDAAFYLCRGQPVTTGGERFDTDALVRLYAPEAGFLGIGTILDDGRVAPKRLFASS